jgi:hypothetical protein
MACLAPPAPFSPEGHVGPAARPFAKHDHSPGRAVSVLGPKVRPLQIQPVQRPRQLARVVLAQRPAGGLQIASHPRAQGLGSPVARRELAHLRRRNRLHLVEVTRQLGQWPSAVAREALSQAGLGAAEACQLESTSRGRCPSKRKIWTANAVKPVLALFEPPPGSKRRARAAGARAPQRHAQQHPLVIQPGTGGQGKGAV